MVGYVFVESATSWNHLVVITALSVSCFFYKFSLIVGLHSWFSLCCFFSLSVNDVLLDYLVRWKVCPEDGPSLCLGCQLCWGIELQKFPPLPGMFCNLLSFIFAVPIILSLFAPSIGTTWLSMLFYHYQYFHLWIFFISRSCLRWSHGDIEHNLGMIL